MDIPAGPVTLPGFLEIPDNAKGIVLFVHGAGSSRHSPRNQAVAKYMVSRGLGTLLMDLLTEEEDTTEARFDIEMLLPRVLGAAHWLKEKKLPIGFIGSSTGAAAALVAAAKEPDLVQAVVSRGGRPDLAGPALRKVQCPTLLIVGSSDFQVLGLNEESFAQLQCEKKLEVVEGATHLFEEAGTLEKASELATDWFLQKLAPSEQ